MASDNLIKEKLNRPFKDYELYIFDLDGTLYFQKPFRIRMAVYLATHVLTHPLAVKDVFIIKKYREVREKWDEIDADGFMKDTNLSMEDRQYAYVAMKMKVSMERVKDAVEFFMMKAPLSILPGYVDEELRKIIHELRESGKKIVIYSDYPVEDKLSALEIKSDGNYTSGDERIGVMKPDKKGIEVILSDFSISPENAVMIGDRYEKDALAAIANEVDYIILSSKKRKRKYGN